MKKCTHCHTLNTDENNFCVKCGLSLAHQRASEKYVQNVKPNVGGNCRSPQFNSQQNSQQHSIIPNNPHPYKRPYQPTRISSGASLISRQPKRRVSSGDKRSFVPILVTILSLAIIVGAIIIWMYREKILGNNAWEKDEEVVTICDSTDETFDQVAEVTVLNGISPFDIVYLSGKIDGKYPVHLILDLKRSVGVCYYDKYGPSNLMGFYITELNNNGNGQWSIILTKQKENDDIDEEWHGTLSSEKFTGVGNFLNKEMPFTLVVNSTLSDSEDPLIKKYMSKVVKWRECVFEGNVFAEEKIFKIRITAQSNQNNEFRDATYHNLSYNVNFPVDIKISQDNLTITGISERNDFRIEAMQSNGEFEGYMYADGKSLPISLVLK